MENSMESFQFTDQLQNNKLAEGTHGFFKEVDLERDYHTSQREGNITGDKKAMSDKSTRQETINRLYTQIYEKTNEEQTQALDKALFQGEKLYKDEETDVKRVQYFVQSGIERDIKELSYETKMADKYAAKKKTKSSKTRLEKRQKAWQKHREATLATAETSFAVYDYISRGLNIGEIEQEAIYKHTLPTLTAKQEALDAMRAAETYDIENNIKMARTKGKRVIDMGDGTTKFFQTLAKLRTGEKCFKYAFLLQQDYREYAKYVPEKEKARYDAKKNKLDLKLANDWKKQCADVNAIASKIPVLLHALNPGISAQSLEAEVENFKNYADYQKKMQFIDMIMSTPEIMNCVRRDMRENERPADFTAVADKLLKEFRSFGPVNNGDNQGEGAV